MKSSRIGSSDVILDRDDFRLRLGCDFHRRVSTMLDFVFTDTNFNRLGAMVHAHSDQDFSYERCLSRYSRLSERHAVCLSDQEAPYIMRRTKPLEDGRPLIGNDRYDGYCAELAKKIADLVHYDYVLREVRDGKFGAQLSDDNWNGMIGELVRGVSV